MKNYIIIFIVMYQCTSSAQTNAFNTFRFPEKQSHFSQLEWMDIMTDLANDSFVLQRIRNYQGRPIPIFHKTYACATAIEHPVRFQYCPECVWVVDQCVSNCPMNTVSISAQKEYGISLRHVATNNSWAPGDTVPYVFLMMCSENAQTGCFLVPVVSKNWMGASIINPRKKYGK